MITCMRLTKTGGKGQKKFRIVIVPKRSKRDGKTIDCLGFVNLESKSPQVTLNQAKWESWEKKGAQISTTVRKLLQNV